MSGLKNVYNFALPAGKQEFRAGMAQTENAAQYWNRLLSGSRSAMLQGVAPETSAIQSRADAARREASAMGTARGGGTAGAAQTAKDRTMAQIDNLLFGVRPTAARETADIGKTELATALQALGIGARSVADLGDLATVSRGLSAQLNRQAQRSVVEAIIGGLTFGA